MVQIEEYSPTDGPDFEVCVYMDEPIRSRLGRTPEIVAVDYLSSSLVDIDVNHRIYHDFDPVGIRNNNTSCPSSSDTTTAHEEWVSLLESGGVPYRGKDCSILIVDSLVGGGCGGGNVSVMGMGDVDEERNVTKGEDSWAGQVYGFMHEVGHCMGFGHGEDGFCRQTGDCHPGDTWYENGKWHNTPNVGNVFDSENLCGQSITPKDVFDEHPGVAILSYNDCVSQHINIEESPSPEKVVGMDVNPAEPIVGDLVHIETTVGNRTPVFREVEKDIEVNGEVISTELFTMLANGTFTATSSFTPESPGSYIISVDGRDISVVDVQSGPTEGEVTITDIEIDSQEIIVGEEQLIWITATNPGEQNVSQTVPITVNGQIIDEITFFLDPGEEVERLALWTPSQTGSATIQVKDAQTQVTVLEKDGDIGDEPPVEPGTPLPGLALAGGMFVLAATLAKPEEGELDNAM